MIVNSLTIRERASSWSCDCLLWFRTKTIFPAIAFAFEINPWMEDKIAYAGWNDIGMLLLCRKNRRPLYDELTLSWETRILVIHRKTNAMSNSNHTFKDEISVGVGKLIESTITDDYETGSSDSVFVPGKIMRRRDWEMISERKISWIQHEIPSQFMMTPGKIRNEFPFHSSLDLTGLY